MTLFDSDPLFPYEKQDSSVWASNDSSLSAIFRHFKIILKLRCS